MYYLFQRMELRNINSVLLIMFLANPVCLRDHICVSFRFWSFVRNTDPYIVRWIPRVVHVWCNLCYEYHILPKKRPGLNKSPHQVKCSSNSTKYLFVLTVSTVVNSHHQNGSSHYR